jgi:acyl carrier protein phosphodiesterase
LVKQGNLQPVNYLAHAYLSLRQPELLVGNMISDFVKGRAQFDYPPGIQRGIQLHRAIDSFTDTHPVNALARKVFKPAVGLYAGAFVDIVYDHYLAKDNLAFPGESLLVYSQWVYSAMGDYTAHFPEKFARMFPYMISQDWLTNYQQRTGIERSMEGLVRRAKYLENSQEAFAAFEAEYDYLEKCYHRFFPELLLFVNNYYRQLLTSPEKP